VKISALGSIPRSMGLIPNMLLTNSIPRYISIFEGGSEGGRLSEGFLSGVIILFLNK